MEVLLDIVVVAAVLGFVFLLVGRRGRGGGGG